MRATKAIALGSVLLVVAAFSVVALSVAAMVTWSLQLSSRHENQSIARDLADSALHQALAELRNNPDFGRQQQEVRLEQLAGLESGRALVTFRTDAQEPYSTNNRADDRGTGWGGQPVAAGRIHLVATGHFRGVEQRVEMMVYSPRYPRAIASEGPIELSRSLVAAVQQLEEVVDANGQLVLNLEKLQRGDVLSNHSQRLRQSTRVKGTAQALLEVVKEDASVVEGEVLAPYERVELPLIPVEDYDPANDLNTLYESRPAGNQGSQTLTGITRFQDGDLRIAGNLVLDQALVYVAGDLEVQGSVQGVGALFVEGETRVGRSLRLAASDHLALVSQGSVRLRGDGKETSFFQGMVVTHGGLSAEGLTLVGSLMAGDRVWIDSCNVLECPPVGLSAFYRPTQVAVDRREFPGTLGSEASPSPGHLTSLVRGLSVRQAVEGNYDWNKPGVLEVEKVNGQFEFTFRYIHHDGHLATYGPTRDREEFVRQAAELTCNEWRRRQNYMVSQAATNNFLANFRTGMQAAIERALSYKAPSEDNMTHGNFELSPNRFLSEGDRLRVLYRREL